MLIPLIGIIGVMLLSAAALAGALMVTRQNRVALQQRANLVAASMRRQVQDDGTAVPSDWHQFMLITDERLRHWFTIGIHYHWGMKSRATALLPIAGLAAAASWVVADWIVGLPGWVDVPLAAGAFVVAPRFVLVREQRRTATQFMDLFPDAIDMVIRMLRAGLPITYAVKAVGQEAPAPVNAIFTTISDQVDIGIPLDEALALAGERIGIVDFRFFAVAVALQRTTGGNLASTLETLSDIIRRRKAVRLKARSATAEVRLSAMFLGGLPFIVIGLLLLLNPHYVAPLLSDRRGNFLVGLAITLLLLGFASMRRMMRRVESV